MTETLAPEGKTDGLTALRQLGQSVWLDDLGRQMIEDGTLGGLVTAGVTGITSNPSIFEHAFRTSAVYDAAIAELSQQGRTVAQICEQFTVEDVSRAADVLLAVYRSSEGRDGFVSLEVAPGLARDRDGTTAEARRLWASLGRPNVMIKVPGTVEGIEAIRVLIAEGINVNVTLLFSPQRHAEVLAAFVEGLEARAARGLKTFPTSVASFFLSRIDTAVDAELDAHGGPVAGRLRGEAAIACARAAYQGSRDMLASPRWRDLQAMGARPQRLLWASTGSKDPSYSPLKYVLALALPDTVTTLPRPTLDAVRTSRSIERPDAASPLPDVSARLAMLGVDLDAVLRRLEDEGIAKFVAALDGMQSAVVGKVAGVARPGAARP